MAKKYTFPIFLVVKNTLISFFVEVVLIVSLII